MGDSRRHITDEINLTHMMADEQGSVRCTQTTVASKQRQYQTTQSAGHKRTHDGAHRVSIESSNNALRDVTYRSTKVDFIRPNQQNTNGPIEASRIQRVGQSGTPNHGISEYSQRKAIASTPTSTTEPRLSLKHPCYGLPDSLVENLSNLGIRSIYPWQSKCLLGSGLLTGEKNLVYSAPTGGGKSLVADVLMLKRIIEQPDKKAILVLPYVALVQEKLAWLRRVVRGVTRNVEIQNPSLHKASMWRQRGDENSVRVVGFFGGSKARVSWSDMDIAVCTIEKVRTNNVASMFELTICRPMPLSTLLLKNALSISWAWWSWTSCICSMMTIAAI